VEIIRGKDSSAGKLSSKDEIQIPKKSTTKDRVEQLRRLLKVDESSATSR